MFLGTFSPNEFRRIVNEYWGRANESHRPALCAPPARNKVDVDGDFMVGANLFFELNKKLNWHEKYDKEDSGDED